MEESANIYPAARVARDLLMRCHCWCRDDDRKGLPKSLLVFTPRADGAAPVGATPGDSGFACQHGYPPQHLSAAAMAEEEADLMGACTPMSLPVLSGVSPVMVQSGRQRRQKRT